MVQVNSATTLLSERIAGIAVLLASSSDIDGDQSSKFSLPAGFGDCILLDIQMNAYSAATLVANPELLGATAWMLDGSEAAHSDIVGSDRFYKTSSDGLTCRIYPEVPVWWRSAEKLQILFMEMDTNVAPTMDIQYYFRVQRVRDRPTLALDRPLQFTS